MGPRIGDWAKREMSQGRHSQRLEAWNSGVEGQAGDVSRPQECLKERALEKYGKRGLGGGRE